VLAGEQTVPNRETPASIMVVDDQPANLNPMEDMLKRQGYGVRSFPRGRMALEAASKNLVVTRDGDLMIAINKTILNAPLIEQIGNFSRTRYMRQPVHVRVVRP
jgi:CheY-like chemotaxis protein